VIPPAETLLAALLDMAPRPIAEAPDRMPGLYGLVDHQGRIGYLGSSGISGESLHSLICHRQRSGNASNRHPFSRMYNTGRMWRQPGATEQRADGMMAKAVRNGFVADHCRAVWLPLPREADLTGIEAAVRALAPPETLAWNDRARAAHAEPTDLVDFTIRRLGLGPADIAALERQRQRFLAACAVTAAPPGPAQHHLGPARHPGLPAFPAGPFRFFALDVETANNHRGSICQIGIACVRPDNRIETWATYIDPGTRLWLWSGLHGITAETVRGAPRYADVFPLLAAVLGDSIVYQHSGFDRSALTAASLDAGLPAPAWQWRDSVQVARLAWPGLKGNGGHGLANLKRHLGLSFHHHDAGEDARAAAEVVLRAEGVSPSPA